jgi:hypothetical protein
MIIFVEVSGLKKALRGEIAEAFSALLSLDRLHALVALLECGADGKTGLGSTAAADGNKQPHRSRRGQLGDGISYPHPPCKRNCLMAA